MEKLMKKVHQYRMEHGYPEDEEELLRFAQYFFELGMEVSNSITAVDRNTAEEIIINLKRVEQDYHIDLTREMEWLRNKAKKGEKV